LRAEDTLIFACPESSNRLFLSHHLAMICWVRGTTVRHVGRRLRQRGARLRTRDSAALAMTGFSALHSPCSSAFTRANSLSSQGRVLQLTALILEFEARFCMSREHRYYVYIMQSVSRRVLYIGVTSNIERRVFQHKNHALEGFSAKYNAIRLVRLERFGDIRSAIAREKQLKGWRRSKKEWLIEMDNPPGTIWRRIGLSRWPGRQGVARLRTRDSAARLALAMTVIVLTMTSKAKSKHKGESTYGRECCEDRGMSARCVARIVAPYSG